MNFYEYAEVLSFYFVNHKANWGNTKASDLEFCAWPCKQTRRHSLTLSDNTLILLQMTFGFCLNLSFTHFLSDLGPFAKKGTLLQRRYSAYKSCKMIIVPLFKLKESFWEKTLNYSSWKIFFFNMR